MPVEEIQKTIQPEGSQTFGTMNHVQPPRHHCPRWSENDVSCQVAYGLLGSESLTKSVIFVHRIQGLQISVNVLVRRDCLSRTN